jgi:myo-inositol-1-phosphate synthase
MKIKELNLQRNVSVSSDLKTLNDILLKCYEEHFLRIEMIDANEHEIRTKQTIIVANMTKIDMILSFSWLKELNSNIDWCEHDSMTNRKCWKYSKENSCSDRRKRFEI